MVHAPPDHRSGADGTDAGDVSEHGVARHEVEERPAGTLQCPKCQGSGSYKGWPCGWCRGKGWIKEAV
jgi:DnaJ-class molecular chaperone